MKKFLFILLAMLCMTASCTSQTPADLTKEEDVPRGGFYLKGKILAIDEYVEVEVIESEYAFGVHWAVISDATVYEDASGNTIGLDALAVGDTVEIEYGGQVMMSYPPKIVAKVIKKLS